MALAVVAVWGVTFISTKVLILAGLQPAEIFFIRFTMAYAGIGALSLRQPGSRRLWSRSWQDEAMFIVLGLAGICTYYRGGKRGEDEIVPNDDPKIMDLLKDLWATGDVAKVAKGVLADEFIWGEDLNAIPGLTDLLTKDLALIQEKGMREAVKSIL